MSWDEIACKHKTDKSSLGHDYMPTYEAILKDKDIVSVLEIGVAGGTSLKTWAEIWPTALIVGVDIVPACRQFQDDRNIVVVTADQSNPYHMQAVASLYGPFDVIIDDGSHELSHVKCSFTNLFGCLKNGGVYIVEDLDGTLPDVVEFTNVHNGRMIPSGEKPEILSPCLMIFGD